jgi:ATP-dependent DNA helicase RecG
MELCDLRGVGKTRLESLRAAGIISLRDLLFFLPIGYKDTTIVTPICELTPGQTAAVMGSIKGKPRLSRFKGLTSVTASLWDETGHINCIWYNQPWMEKNLSGREQVLLYGRMEERKGKRQLLNPSLEEEPGIIPIYRPLDGLPGKIMRGLVETALTQVEDTCPETLPNSLRLRYGLCEKNYAIRQAHFPDSRESLEAARRRLSFEQMLLYQAALGLLRERKEQGIFFPVDMTELDSFWESMPFEPTMAQRRVLNEITADLSSAHPMARLVQGDVGSGKTALAFGALYLAVRHGFQGALMAPTEILARQHLKSAKAMLGPLGITCGLLMGGMKAAERREAIQAIREGIWQVVIGTHALISEGVEYHNLGLVVTDEQHRFGVRQRTALARKGTVGAGELSPNVLVMSATPIPRTLALILYGDLDLSVVDELPPGRTPVTTRIVAEDKREAMYGFIKNEVAKGRQAYIVCPLVEESEALADVKAAQTQYAALVAGPLKGLRVGLTYGKQPPNEKAEVLDAFAAGDLHVLVATTVIEVGVNVPNATIMVIEDAQRYGLSQLHQLRGRVGRGSEQSWCFLLSEPNERLKMLTATNDGFEIAKKDLQLRGPGEFFGTRQHGAPLLPGLSIDGDVKLLDETQKCLRELRNQKERRVEWAIVQAQARQDFAHRLQQVSLS